VIKLLTDAAGQEVSGGEERESYEIAQVIPLGIKDPEVDLHQVWGGDSDGNLPESMLSTLQQGPSEEELRQAFKVIQGVNIPAFPDVIFAIKAELAKEMPDIDSISALVSTDVALSGIAMKTVNSPIFGLKVKVTSIKHAITLLGLERFQSLVFSSALKRVMISDNAHPRMLRFWAEASAVGQCASYIADMMMDVDNEEAYMAGLFQACGTLLLSQKFPKYMEDVLPKAATKPFSVIAYENKKYQTNHTLVGYVLARYWQVPEEVCLAIYHHHTQPLDKIQLQNVRVFSAILSVAISIVEWVCYGLKSETTERMEYQQQALNDLLITEQTLEEIQQDVTDMLLNEFQDLGV
jgi:HD-like signal output (HDOD) protein